MSKHCAKGSAPRTFSIKSGYFSFGRVYPSKHESAQTAKREAAAKLCSECGAPAVRIFSGSKPESWYGRCKKHLSGGVVPVSYRR